MKKTFYVLSCLIVTITIGCIQKDNPKPPGCGPVTADTAYNALDSATAMKWVSEYQKLKIDSVKFFTSAASDLWEALGLQNKPAYCSHYPKVRIYLGLDETKNTHVLFTPAHSDGSVIWFSGKYKKTSKKDVSPVYSGAYLMDLTSPCPTTCPPNL